VSSRRCFLRTTARKANEYMSEKASNLIFQFLTERVIYQRGLYRYHTVRPDCLSFRRRIGSGGP
jgi:hypothetical protein